VADSDTDPTNLETTAADLPAVIGRLRRRLRGVGAADELNPSDLGVIAQLGKQGSMSAAALARAESMRPQSMATLLSRLEERGHVERQAHPSDRRQVQFRLTAAGMVTNRQRRTARQLWLLQALSTFTEEEQRTLSAAVELLSRLADSE